MNRPTEEAIRIAQQRKAAAAASLPDWAAPQTRPPTQYSQAEIISETIDAYEAYYYGS
jgi:hypothetical protein